MNSIQTINLTEKDFQLLVDGLEALPERGAAGELVGDLLFGMLDKDNPNSEGRSELKKHKEKLKTERELLKDDVRVLQGKLIMLKRYLIENNLMQQATELLR
jgi:chaperonin cofactor prefoldin